MWTRKLETCFAAIGLLTAATLAGCVVDGEHKTLDEIQSNLTTAGSSSTNVRPVHSICDGLSLQACAENQATCVPIWRTPPDCPNVELCDLEFVLCSALGQGCGLPGLPACPAE